MSGHPFLLLYHKFCADVVGLMITYYSVADYPEVLCLKKQKLKIESENTSDTF